MRKGVRRMRKLLVHERDRAHERLRRGSHVESALSELRAVEREIVAWQASSESGSRSAKSSLRCIYGKGRRRARKARKAKLSHTRAMHEWRKRVKDLRYATEALGASDDGATSALRSPRQRRRMERLASIATQADTLGEALGEEHDLAVLQAWVRERGKKAGAGPGSRRSLRKAIKRRRKRLRRRVLREGAKLYELEPGAFVRRLGR
jgi:CHAD domain-containing protein